MHYNVDNILDMQEMHNKKHIILVYIIQRMGI